MARPKVRLNSAGVEALLNDEGVAQYLLELARDVEDAAVANAPVESGDYVDSIYSELVHTDRAVARVVADAPHALAVEAATGNLARALDAAGRG